LKTVAPITDAFGIEITTFLSVRIWVMKSALLTTSPSASPIRT